MIRTITYGERNVATTPPAPVTLAAGVAKEILPDQRETRGEISIRYIQNATGARLFLAFNTVNCDNILLWHNFVDDGQIFDCSFTRESVWGFSAAGGVVGVRISYRSDMAHSINPFKP